jgi:threonine synthase
MNLVCTECGESCNDSSSAWRCRCGAPLDLDFHPIYDFGCFAGREPGIWRYREALPVEDPSAPVTLGEGGTPLIESKILGRRLLLKLEYISPTGSFKDRGASVLISRARELGIERVIEDSSGNAGASIATYCAAAGIACEILVPEGTSPGKTAQIEAAGAKLVRIPGGREATADAARKRADKVFYASHYWNPFFFHGTKTFAFELVEQLGGRPPEAIVFPLGHGSLLYGTYIGFSELKRLGVINTLPALIGAQAAACSPFHHLHRGEVTLDSFTAGDTIAEGIRVTKPARAGQILRAIKETGGLVVAVDEEEIIEALAALTSSGFFVEPTSAVPLAAVKKLDSAWESVAIPLTGGGLKAPEIVARLAKGITGNSNCG